MPGLIIVESPTKAKTLTKFLGPQYRILSSYGHIRDLPKNKFGIDIENNFQPKYLIVPKAKKIIQILKKEIKNTTDCLIATDPDREGEAIAWHLVQTLELDKTKNYQRIVFHEITKQAIEEALKNPRGINMNLVNAQQARRILDRIIGYKLSPFLWKKVVRGLSAGRVQSVAVRLIVEREREIQNFIPQEYWTIEALFKKIPISNLQLLNKSQITDPESQKEFKALLVKKDGKIISKLDIKTKKEAEKILKHLKKAQYRVINIEKKEIRRESLPPFTTSTLQQESWQRFKWPAKMTMQLAQQLYEMGNITYHRTDSLNISELALSSARKFILENYGQNYYQFKKFKTKSKLAQEAHEAIRPTYLQNTPEKISVKLEKNQLKLYDLIWRRFIASQMSPACFETTKIEIEAEIKNQRPRVKNYIFKATGQILKFDGFLKVYPINYEETELPDLEINEILELIKLIPSQHFTQPPPRYNEATLIKILEENGIGRPSTYAPILATIQERNYVEKDEQKRFRPTEIGIVVNDLLVRHFPEVVDINFTAKMEEQLDEIAQGQKKWVPVIREFYGPFEKNLLEKEKELKKSEIAQEFTEKKCPRCGNLLIIRLGKYGKFYTCSTFPKCKYTESLEKNKLNVKCPICRAEILEKRTKKRKIFYACSNWPECSFALWDKPLNKTCPKCGSILIETKRKQIKCSNKKCDFELKKKEKSVKIKK